MGNYTQSLAIMELNLFHGVCRIRFSKLHISFDPENTTMSINRL